MSQYFHKTIIKGVEQPVTLAEKQANFLVAGLAHLGQNVYTAKKVLKPQQQYLANFLEGTTGKAYRTKATAFTDGARTSTISPEQGALSDKFRQLGSEVMTKLKESNQVLTKRDWVLARQAVRGISKNSPTSIHQQLQNLPAAFDDVALPAGVKVRDLKSDKGLNLIEEFKSNKLTSTLESLGGKLPKQHPETTLEANKKWELGGKITGLAATTAADPMTGIMNSKKLFMASEKAKQIPSVNKAHEKVLEYLAHKPVMHSYNTGKHMSDFTGLIVNPTLQQAQRLAAAAGFAANKF